MKPAEEELDPREREELDRLAAELRAAHPPAALSPDFADRVWEKAGRRHGLRAAMRRQPLMRAAAALLLVSVVGAPVAAVIHAWKGGGVSRPVIGFERAPDLPEREEIAREQMPGVVPPEAAWDDRGWTPPREEWRRALERSNRLALAAASWEQAPAAPQPPAEAWPPPTEWSEADAEALWTEFLRRVSAGELDGVPDDLVARAQGLWARGDAEVRNALAGWHWVLTGSAAGAPQPRAWQGAPYVGD